LSGYVPNLQLERMEGATHWIVHEQPAWVATRLAAFLK
jgi:pimeloyl-ACP methyl ester carboxylesterase